MVALVGRGAVHRSAGRFSDVHRDSDTAIGHFTALVNTAGAGVIGANQLPLGECVALVGAAIAPEETEVEAVLAQLDGIAAGVGESSVEGVRRLLFDELGFSGNRTDYYSLDNSRLDLVLERRVGIPISLGIVMVEVARRVGVPLHLCALPGHVVVGDGARRWYDAFDGGRALDVEACRALVAELNPVWKVEPEHLEPVGAPMVLIRVLNNMVAIASRSGGPELYTLLRLRAALPAMSRRERLLLGGLHAQHGELASAADELESAVRVEPGVDDDAVLRLAQRHRAALN